CARALYYYGDYW
nr:immunoglobulin heavy chain junction region [Mus musculus]MBK4186122.1 immunoglobulin heavy chain junction region [Mus musculus]MBK4186123.1 immunoglobulin heavy chain junction region [Mus musculus]MBK4186124.1 immunoglobulin heavy chain junction region [Mus musculus]MBK4186125.1 immunoglobulin heavy chain junction region [Mus musculus]